MSQFQINPFFLLWIGLLIGSSAQATDSVTLAMSATLSPPTCDLTLPTTVVGGAFTLPNVSNYQSLLNNNIVTGATANYQMVLTASCTGIIYQQVSLQM